MAAEENLDPPAKGTRSQTDFGSLFFNSQTRPYTLIIDDTPIPGFIMLGRGHIFFTTTDNLTLVQADDNACIDLIYKKSKYDQTQYVLYIHSYFDTNSPTVNQECHTLYSSPDSKVNHKQMFDIFDMLAKQIDIDRIELVDGSRIQLPQCKWNLRILNRLLQKSTGHEKSKAEPQTFYEKFGFKQYDNINIFRRIDYQHLPQCVKTYIDNNKIPKNSTEPMLIEVVKHMYARCNSSESFGEYEELKNNIITLLDSDYVKTADLYYRDVDKKQVSYMYDPETATIILTTIPEGGRKKSKKNKKRKRKNKSKKYKEIAKSNNF